MDLKQFKECVESCYKPLLGEEFSAKCTKNSSAVATGSPRDILAIHADDKVTAGIVENIKKKVSKLEKNTIRRLDVVRLQSVSGKESLTMTITTTGACGWKETTPLIVTAYILFE